MKEDGEMYESTSKGTAQGVQKKSEFAVRCGLVEYDKA